MIMNVGFSIGILAQSQVEPAIVNPIKSLQLESGFNFYDSSDKEVSKIISPSFLFIYGLHNSVDIRVAGGLNLYNPDASGGFLSEEIEAGIKWQLYSSQDQNSIFSLLSNAIIPIKTSDGIKVEDIFFSNRLCLDKTIDDRTAVTFNLGYVFRDEIEDGTYEYAVLFSKILNERWGLFLEPYGEVEKDGRHLSNLDLSLFYTVNDRLQIDMTGGTGLNHNLYQMSGRVTFMILE